MRVALLHLVLAGAAMFACGHAAQRESPADATAPDAAREAGKPPGMDSGGHDVSVSHEAGDAGVFVGRAGDLGSSSAVIDHGGENGGYVGAIQHGAIGATWQPPGCTETVTVAAGVTGAAWGEDTYGAIDRSPHAVHTSWSSDTSTTLAAIWETDANTRATYLAYGDSPTRLDHFVQGVTFTNPPQLYDLLAYPLLAHEVHVCGLLPSHTYYFAVGGDGWYGRVYSVVTAPPPGAMTPFRFAVTGDSNFGYSLFAEVTAKLGTYAPAWTLFTGDLVHDGPSQEQWESWFDAGGPLIATTPTMTAHGNHEEMATAFFALEALPGAEDLYSFDYGNAHFVVLNDSPPNPDDLTGFEAAFLDTDLTAAEARPVPPTWLITVHHRPMFCSDPDEGSNLTVRGAWNAIQQKHHVDLDFNGHAHHYESTYPISGDGGIVDAGGIRYITSGGAGAAFDSPTPTPNPWTLVYYAGLSFGIVDVNGPTLTLQGYRVDGTTLEPTPIVLTK
jgi:hypothetical protein